MKDRAVEIAGFLAQSGWEDALETPLQADFSSRQFARLVRQDGRQPRKAILMDAAADGNASQFVMIAELLRKFEISAPEIYAENAELGLVLMEDFGNRNIGPLIDTSDDVIPHYKRAVDVLVHLHKTFNRDAVRGLDLPLFGGALFAAQAELFIDAWIPFEKGREATREEGEAFREAWKQTLRGIDRLPQTFMLRDFMPDNLMELPDRPDWRSIGVLDFQDGGIGPLPYDIASLCEVVRRDRAGLMLMDEMILYYHEKAAPPLSVPELRSACRVLSAQRHIRILGIIARIALKNGRREKLAYMPRIRAYLDELLRDNALVPVRVWMEEHGRVA